MLPYSDIVRELLVAQKALSKVMTLVHNDRFFRNTAFFVRGEIERFQQRVEYWETQEDPDHESGNEG